MDGLNKRIASDWYDIQEALKDTLSLDEYFELPRFMIEKQAEKLKFAVDEGMVEYKQVVIKPLFNFLENVKYQSPGADKIKIQIDFIKGLLFVCLVQTMVLKGIIKLSVQPEQEKDPVEEIELKQLMQEINDIISANPDLKTNNTFKAVLIQVSQLQKENETLQRLLPTIKQENKEAYLTNFKRRFLEIEAKIRKNYAQFMEEEVLNPDGMVRNILAVFPLKDLLRPVLKQCEIIAKLCSTLMFVYEEKYKTREILLELLKQKEVLFGEFKKEEQVFRRFIQSEIKRPTEYMPNQLKTLLDNKMARYTRAMGNEVIFYLEKKLGQADN